MAVPTRPDARVVSLGPAAPPARRTLGPTAWALLVHLVESAEDCASGTVSRQSVRGAADALGLAKDTVARAFRRLTDEGFVTYRPGRSHDGRFGRSHYRLTLPPDLFVATTALTTTRLPSVPSRRRVATDAQQLSLIDSLTSAS